jgi:hypothetical protein
MARDLSQNELNYIVTKQCTFAGGCTPTQQRPVQRGPISQETSSGRSNNSDFGGGGREWGVPGEATE